MEFDTNKKRVLADSDLGSWFSQVQQWPEQFQDSATCSLAMTQTATCPCPEEECLCFQLQVNPHLALGRAPQISHIYVLLI